MQDLASEPLASLIVDFLLVVSGQRQPAPYRRLLDLIVFGQGLDEEREYRTRSRWDRFLASVRRRITEGDIDLAEQDSLEAVVDELMGIISRDVLVGLSPDYAYGDRLQRQLEATISRAHDLLKQGDDAASVLALFSGDRAVRIMSIHKSKGLEFDTVVVLGVENQTFWGDVGAERSAYFVGISRAKRRLFLTVSSQREQPNGARRWHTRRIEHNEFIGYAEPYL